MLTAAAVVLPSCSRRSAPVLTREAFLVFDNLTGDPSLDWIAQTAPRILAHDLTGVPKMVPLLAATVRDAYLEHAARFVHGYYEIRDGKLHFEIDVEDASTHRTIQTAPRSLKDDGSIRGALDNAARSFNPAAQAFPASDDVIAAWGHGNFERAAALDPRFALAWISWTQQAATSGDTARARDLANRALAQPNLDSNIDRAQLEMMSARLRQDDSARIEASRALASLIPYDPSVWSSLAQEEMRARRFADAARDYRTLSKTDPGDSSALNLMGYARALAGDLDGAHAAFQQYGRAPGQAVNSTDSWGESLFINGKFDQAERQFEDAYKREPGFIQGETLWKAAHARWLAGDLPEADKIVERYLQDRAKARDPLVTWRRANWLYETGRRDQARDLLRHVPIETNPQAATAMNALLRLWADFQPPADLAKLEQGYRESDPVNDGLARVMYANALVQAGRKSEARELLQRWPLPAGDDSLLQSLLYPMFFDLRKATS